MKACLLSSWPGAQDPASLEEEAFSLALNHKHKALADERVRQNSVGPWSDDPGSPGHLKRAAGHAATPKRGQAAKRHPSAVRQRPASAQRPSPTTTVSAGRPASATTRRPTSATVRPTPLQPPGSAKRSLGWITCSEIARRVATQADSLLQIVKRAYAPSRCAHTQGGTSAGRGGIRVALQCQHRGCSLLRRVGRKQCSQTVRREQGRELCLCIIRVCVCVCVFVCV